MRSETDVIFNDSKRHKKAGLLFLLSLSLVSFSCSNTNMEDKQPEPDISFVHVPAGLSGQALSFANHTAEQEGFLSAEDYRQYLLDHQIEGGGDISRPEAVHLDWNDVASSYTLWVSESEKFENPRIYQVNKSEINLYNFKLNQTYYLRLIYNDGDFEDNTLIVSSKPPRIMYVVGISNFRDEGGYALEQGGHSKQGMLYRGWRPEGVSQKGMDVIYNHLSIKTEIDLQSVREVGEGGRTRLTKLDYQFCPMDGDVLEARNDDSVRKVFSILAKPESYPIYFHCAIGTDRTGFIGFLVNAILGTSYDDCLKDYLLSNFAPIGGKRTEESIENYLSLIRNSEGESLLEKASYFLRTRYDIDETTIQGIRDILIDK